MRTQSVVVGNTWWQETEALHVCGSARGKAMENLLVQSSAGPGEMETPPTPPTPPAVREEGNLTNTERKEGERQSGVLWRGPDLA